jgi:hypothetical protein
VSGGNVLLVVIVCLDITMRSRLQYTQTLFFNVTDYCIVGRVL